MRCVPEFLFSRGDMRNQYNLLLLDVWKFPANTYERFMNSFRQRAIIIIYRTNYEVFISEKHAVLWFAVMVRLVLLEC